jgi:hypothetical protein
MILRCNKADECNSTECEHKGDHEFLDGWCDDGQCRWSSDCRCVGAMMSREDLEGRIDNILCDLVYFRQHPEIKTYTTEIATKKVMALIDEYMQGKAND